MASKGEGGGVGVLVVRDDKVIESRNLSCRSGVAGNGVWVKRGDGGEGGVGGKKVRMDKNWEGICEDKVMSCRRILHFWGL